MTQDKELLRVRESRVELETRLDELKRSLQSEVGWVPKSNNWVLPLFGMAGGILFGRVFKRLTQGRKRKPLQVRDRDLETDPD